MTSMNCTCGSGANDGRCPVHSPRRDLLAPADIRRAALEEAAAVCDAANDRWLKGGISSADESHYRAQEARDCAHAIRALISGPQGGRVEGRAEKRAELDRKIAEIEAAIGPELPVSMMAVGELPDTGDGWTPALEARARDLVNAQCNMCLGTGKSFTYISERPCDHRSIRNDEKIELLRQWHREQATRQPTIATPAELSEAAGLREKSGWDDEEIRRLGAELDKLTAEVERLRRVRDAAEEVVEAFNDAEGCLVKDWGKVSPKYAEAYGGTSQAAKRLATALAALGPTKEPT